MNISQDHVDDRTLKEYFSSPEKCLFEIKQIEKTLTNGGATNEEYKQLLVMLYIMMTHCPEQVKADTESIINVVQKKQLELIAA